MASAILKDVKDAIRVKADSVNDEVEGLIAACKKEMEIAGILVIDETDPLVKQAIKLYCKAHYGYDEKSEKFRASFEALRDSMALSGEYSGRGNMDGSSADMG